MQLSKAVSTSQANSLVLLLAALLFVLIQQSVQAQYYVSPAGSDNNPGSHQQPFKTIQKAADLMLAGDTCYIMYGKYRETVTPANNGTPGNPLVFMNYNNERVVILGSDSIYGWSAYQGGIYKTYAPDTITQLFVNGERQYPARYPDFFSGDLYSTSDWNPVTADEYGDAVFSGMSKPDNYWVGAYCKILTGHKWVAHVGKVSSSNGNQVHCDLRSWPWNDYNPDVYLGPGMGYIYKHLHALDKTNEWHWQNDTLYYFPEDESLIDTLTVEARTRLYGFNCEEKAYIIINNIHFVWSSVNFGEANDCTLDGGSIWFPTPFFYYDNSWTRNEGGEINYSIDHWDGKGVYVSGSDNTVKNCYVAYSWGDGISVGGSNNRIENCLVEHCDFSATDCAALSATGFGHNLIGNTLRSSARSILVHRFSNSTNIKYNHLHNCGIMCDDLGLTYSYHTNGGGSEISYNWVHDNHASGTASGIYLDNYDSNYVVHHNVVWNCNYAIHTNKPAVNHEIYNNTVWNSANAQWAWGYAGTEIENQKVINNLSDKPWNVGTFFQTNLTTNSPQFVDPQNGDFRLQESSPAIDYGSIIPGITDDYMGAAPDAGAYEFGGEDWVAGSNVEIPDLSDIVIIPEPEPQDLIAWYPFNGNALDESGNGYHAGDVLGAILSEDRNGNPQSAYAFDGVDDKIIIPNIGVNLAQNFTITYWFQPNDLVNRQWLFGNRHTETGGDGNGLESDIFEDEVRIFWPAQLALSYDLTSTDWQFIVYSKESNIYRLYKDATLVDIGSNASNPSNNNPWRIGAHYNQDGWGAHFNGKIDDIRVYGRVLSVNEIEELFNGSSTGFLNPAPNEGEFFIYPNPGSSTFFISTPDQQHCNIEVFNFTGQKVFEKKDSKEIDLSSIKSGMYMVLLLDDKHQIMDVQKIIKMQN